MTRHALPCALPSGERILWQGAPRWQALARDALHLRGLGLYFAGLIVWLGVSQTWAGTTPMEVGQNVLIGVGVAAVPLLLGVAYAWFAARAATYTITDRRVVIRMGAAMPMTVNLPFARIQSAGLRARSGGLGEINLRLPKGERFSSIVLWPHSRVMAGQPVLRGLPDADQVGQVLAQALAASVDPVGETVEFAADAGQTGVTTTGTKPTARAGETAMGDQVHGAALAA